MSKVPNSKPKLSAVEVDKILEAKGVNRKKYPVCVLAVRGYYLDTMGEKGKNDRGVFDDAAFILTPTLFASVNWNVDPSSYRKGKGTGSGKGMASLKVGGYPYQIGKHKGKGPAGVQVGPVTVIRDGINGNYEDTGMFGINHHWGSNSGTSSAGCQTAPAAQWPSYINPIVAELKRYNVKHFWYQLMDVSEMNQIINNTAPVVETIVSNSDTPDYTAAINIIKEFEGFRSHPYKDTGGVWTIGYGTIKFYDGTPVNKYSAPCTQEQALEWLLRDLNLERIPAVVNAVIPSISNNEASALVSFVYNVGVKAFMDSTLLKKLNLGKPKEEVAAEFMRWNKDNGKVIAGLTRRRKMERELFLS